MHIKASSYVVLQFEQGGIGHADFVEEGLVVEEFLQSAVGTGEELGNALRNGS